MATTTFSGLARSYSGRRKSVVSPGVLVLSEVVSGLASSTDADTDAARMRIGTSATAGALFVLPKGAIPISLVSLGGSGGSTPTVDIGTSDDDDGFFVGADSDSTAGATLAPNGALVVNTGIVDDVQVTIVANGGSPTGTASFIFVYTVVDDGLPGESQ